jgi:hypothetical protein
MKKIRKKVSYFQKIYIDDLDTIRVSIMERRIDRIGSFLNSIGMKSYIKSYQVVSISGEQKYESGDAHVLVVPLKNYTRSMIKFYDDTGIYEQHYLNKPAIIDKRKEHSIFSSKQDLLILQIALTDDFTISALRNSSLNNNPY